MNTAGSSGATAVITHRVREAQHEHYEAWLAQILPLVTAAQGFLDVQLIRPVSGLTFSYTIVLRFDCEAVSPILSQGDAYTIHTGMDFLFTPHDGSQRVPVKWKQFLVTWSAILPLTLGLPLLLAPGLHALGWHSHLVITSIVSAVAVFLMVYLIMPRYTRLVRRWLFR